MIPPYEEHSARIKSGYNIEQWYLLHYMERALAVAVQRTEQAIEAHYSDAQVKASKR